jgi:hypothetical protein
VRRTPTAEEELILLLCGTAERRAGARDSLNALAARVDYEVLTALMARQLLLPLLGARLREAAPQAIPESFAVRHERAVGDARLRGLALEALERRIRHDLATAGIRALPLKGVVLSRELYGDPGTRQSKDVDLLVAAEQIDRAAEVLRGIGYRKPPGASPGRLHLELEHVQGRLPAVELHWRVHWYEDRFSRRMLNRAGAVDPRPQPADELAALLLFFARDGFAGLRLAADAAAWWDLHRPAGGDLPLLDPIASEAPELRAALVAAAISLRRLVGVPAASLLSQRPATRRVLTATRLANWTVTGDLDQVSANITLVDLLLSPLGSSGRFARRALLPPGPRIATMYGLPAGTRWRLAFWRLVHGPKLLLRYAIALWRVRRGRSWMPIPTGFAPAAVTPGQPDRGGECKAA